MFSPGKWLCLMRIEFLNEEDYATITPHQQNFKSLAFLISIMEAFCRKESTNKLLFFGKVATKRSWLT
jgi:hypothetical protein